MKNILKKIFKSFFIQLFSFFILTGFIAFAAISWPQGSPDGEVSGGVFMERFDKIRNNSDCGNGKYLAGYDTNFEKICKTVPAGPKGDKGATGLQGPAGPQGPKGDSIMNGTVIKGTAGPQGPAGPKGDKGATGPQGPAGPKGDKGDSVTLNFKCPAGQFVVGFSNNSPICGTPSTGSAGGSSGDRYTLYNNDTGILNYNYSSDYKMLEAVFKITETTNGNIVTSYTNQISWTKGESKNYIRTTDFTIQCGGTARSCDTGSFTTTFGYNSSSVYGAKNTGGYGWNGSTDVKIVLVKLKGFK